MHDILAQVVIKVVESVLAPKDPYDSRLEVERWRVPVLALELLLLNLFFVIFKHVEVGIDVSL